MSQPRSAKPAKLVIGLLGSDRDELGEAITEVQQCIGRIDMVSPWLTFDFTDYYTEEMGKPLVRRVLSFRGLIEQESLAEIKLRTNAIEKKFSVGGKRRVNIDPGYLLYERFVLATGKNFSHRIYIGSGIYADLTLIFQQGTFQSLPWTYPDYRDANMIGFLMRVRDKYGADLQTHPACASETQASTSQPSPA